jgi:hypothetical protein
MTGKATPGQDIYSSPLGSARVINRVVEAGDDYAQRRRLSNGGPPVGFPLPTDLVKVKNSTGADRAAGSVLQIGNRLLTTLDREHLWVDGIAPTAQGVPNVAVLLGAHPSTAILPAQVQGACLALVNVTHTGDRFCYVQSGQYVLKGCAIGHHRILEDPASTGQQLLLVALGDGVLSCFGKADVPIPSNTSNTVRVYAGTPGAESDTGQTIEACFNKGFDLADEQDVAVSILHGRFYVTPMGCS